LNNLKANAPLQEEEWCRTAEEKAVVRENWQLASGIITSLCGEHVPRKSKDHRLSALKIAPHQFREYFGWQVESRLIVELDYDRAEFVCSVEPPQVVGKDNYREWLAHVLWSVVFDRKGYERLRSCRQCQKWFVATAPNMRGEFCSLNCRNGYWTRDRRKKAGHDLGNKKGKQP